MPSPTDFIFGLDIETLGLPGKLQMGGLKAYASPSTRGFVPDVFSIALSTGGTGSRAAPAFLGHTHAHRFDINKFKAIGGDPSEIFNVGSSSHKDQVAKALEQSGHLVSSDGSAQLRMSREQVKYLQGVAPDSKFMKDFMIPSMKEARAENGKVFTNQASMLHSFHKRLKNIANDASSAGVKPTIVGHNITGFDMGFLVEAMEKVDPKAAKDLQKTLKGFNLRDTGTDYQKVVRKTYEGASDAVKQTSLAKEWLKPKNEFLPGWSLDVAAETLGVKGRDNVKAHGALEDARLSVDVAEKLDASDATVSPRAHAEAMVRTKKKSLVDHGNSVLNSLSMKENSHAPDMPHAVSQTQAPKTSSVNLLQTLDSMPGKIKGLFEKHTKAKLAGVAALGGMAYLGLSSSDEAQTARHVSNSLLSSLINPMARRNEYISSSTLGMTNQTDLLSRTYDPRMQDLKNDTSGDMRKSRAIMEAGNVIHEAIQQGLVARGAATATEVYVEDPRNKVFGYIDAMLPGGVPLEIKSIGGSQFEKLSRPKDPHISQANFYALAQSSQTAMIMYVSREDPTKHKVFAILPAAPIMVRPTGLLPAAKPALRPKPPALNPALILLLSIPIIRRVLRCYQVLRR